MTIELYQGGDFETAHERRAVDQLIGILVEEFGDCDDLYVVLADYNLLGKSIDLTILKKDAILIVELKSESQGFRATENLWPVDNKRNVGGNYSPFSQIREYRNKWRDLLKQSGRELNCLRALPDVEFNRASGGSVCGH